MGQTWSALMLTVSCSYLHYLIERFSRILKHHAEHTHGDTSQLSVAKWHTEPCITHALIFWPTTSPLSLRMHNLRGRCLWRLLLLVEVGSLWRLMHGLDPKPHPFHVDHCWTLLHSDRYGIDKVHLSRKPHCLTSAYGVMVPLKGLGFHVNWLPSGKSRWAAPCEDPAKGFAVVIHSFI